MLYSKKSPSLPKNCLFYHMEFSGYHHTMNFKYSNICIINVWIIFFKYNFKKLRKWHLQTVWVLYICVCSHTHTITIGKILILNSPYIVCLHAQSLGNVIDSVPAHAASIICTSTRTAPNWICSYMRMHFFTVSFSADYTGPKQQLLSIFMGWGGGEQVTLYTGTNAWFSQLLSPLTALSGRCKQCHKQTRATYTYLDLNCLLILI